MKNKTNLRKIFNVVQIVLFAVALLVMLFSPYKSYKVYELKYSYGSQYINGVASVRYPEAYENSPVIAEGTSHFFDASEEPIVFAICLIPVALILVGIALGIFSLARKSLHRDSVLHVVIPLLAILSFSFMIFCLKDIFPVGISENSYYVYRFGSSPLLPVNFFLFLTFVVSLAKRSKSFNPEQVIKVEAVQQPSNANEIKQYKELLDSGAITQEEFDMKKKELLGL